MSYQAIRWAYSLEGLGFAEKAVLAFLANAKNSETGLCCPTVEQMARALSCGEKTVRRSIKRLEAISPPILAVEKRRTANGTANFYRIFDVPLPVTVTASYEGDYRSESPDYRSESLPLPVRVTAKQEVTGNNRKKRKPSPSSGQLSDEQKRLNRLFRRRDSTEWGDKEARKFREVAKRENFLEELAEIERVYSIQLPRDVEGDYRRQSLQTLLNNWTDAVDKCANGKWRKNGSGNNNSHPKRETIT